MNALTEQILTDINEGSAVRIHRINGGDALKSKLLSMGIIPEQRVVLVKKSGENGPVIIRVNNTRIIIGHGMAEKITVTI